jgi:hypothetical protein
MLNSDFRLPAGAGHYSGKAKGSGSSPHAVLSVREGQFMVASQLRSNGNYGEMKILRSGVPALGPTIWTANLMSKDTFDYVYKHIELEDYQVCSAKI